MRFLNWLLGTLDVKVVKRTRVKHKYDCGKWDADVIINGKRLRVRGDCTVWHYFPSGIRCSTSVEHRLSEEWTRWNMKGEVGS